MMDEVCLCLQDGEDELESRYQKQPEQMAVDARHAHHNPHLVCLCGRHDALGGGGMAVTDVA